MENGRNKSHDVYYAKVSGETDIKQYIEETDCSSEGFGNEKEKYKNKILKQEKAKKRVSTSMKDILKRCKLSIM